MLYHKTKCECGAIGWIEWIPNTPREERRMVNLKTALGLMNNFGILFCSDCERVLIRGNEEAIINGELLVVDMEEK